MPRLQERPTDRRGMTLIEMMVALAIFAVVTAVVIGFLTGSRRTYDDTSDRAHYQQSARAVLSLMTRELRSAGCDPTEVGVEKLVGADATTLRCRMDLDGDGSTLGTNPDEDIRYTWDTAAAELQRTTASGTVTILQDVQNLSFSYLDGDGNPLNSLPLSAGDRDRVRFVVIEIDGELRNGEPVSYTTRIHLRNG
jgi:prepilin-type N-terminal cleavage/methylation domain-containing protein